MPRLASVTAYQRDNPPVHQMVAAYLGIKPKAAERPVTPDDGAVREVAEFMPERALDATQAATLAILKAKGWA